MVTPEERISRLEAIQEANAQQLTEVSSRTDRILHAIEVARRKRRRRMKLLADRRGKRTTRLEKKRGLSSSPSSLWEQ